MRILALLEINKEILFEESGIFVLNWEPFAAPSLKYPRLNLAHLLTVPADKRNEYIGLTYNYKSANAYHCCEEETAICGNKEDGYLEEESLVEYVLGYSGITIGEVHDTEEPNLENSIELIQNGVTYLVDYIMSNAGCSGEPCEHFNFNTLRLLKENEKK